jgi:hypothetical protein
MKVQTHKRAIIEFKGEKMEIIRGTTPTIIITITNKMDLTTIQAVWVYISQQNKVKVDKLFSDVVIDAENNKILVKLTQEDTLALKSGDALFQIRLLLADGTALATIATDIKILEIYKGGIISEELDELPPETEG